MGADGGLARHHIREVFRRDRCSAAALSPDGRAVACQSIDGDFLLYDVDSGDVLLQKKEFFPASPLENLLNLLVSRKQLGPNVGFSPDGRMFIAAYAGLEASLFVAANTLPPKPEVHYLAFDLESRKEIKLEGSIRDRVGRGFVFRSPDRIVGVHLEPKKSAIVSFPEGKVVEEIPLGFQSLDVPARGNLLFLRPVNKAAVGVMDLSTKKSFSRVRSLPSTFTRTSSRISSRAASWSWPTIKGGRPSRPQSFRSPPGRHRRRCRIAGLPFHRRLRWQPGRRLEHGNR